MSVSNEMQKNSNEYKNKASSNTQLFLLLFKSYKLNKYKKNLTPFRSTSISFLQNNYNIIEEEKINIRFNCCKQR